MSKNECNHREFWTLYKALNKDHFSKEKSFICSCGKTVHYEFYGYKEMKDNYFLSAFSAFLWIFPAFGAIVISVIFGFSSPIVFLYAVLFVIMYHFAGMYYFTQSPVLVLTEEKKGFFSRK